jgi:hypothetical protein
VQEKEKKRKRKEEEEEKESSRDWGDVMCIVKDKCIKYLEH